MSKKVVADKQIENRFVNKNPRYDIGIGVFEPEDKKSGERKRFVSIRLWTVDRDGKRLPTREGLVFDPETLPAVIDALNELREEL